MERYGNIEACIEVMNAYGAEFVFFNPGIDNVPLLETLAEYRASGRKSPRGVLCLDEFVTMTAAHGAWMASGRPQVVSVHSELGVLQLGGSLHNAQWGRVPVVFLTENQGPARRTTWRGDAFDQGAMVRSFVKWDLEVTGEDDAATVLAEAFRIATTEPCGPVYLNLPRQAFWDTRSKAGNGPVKISTPHYPQANNSDLEKVADILLEADDPLIVTGYYGRNPEAVAGLVKFAETIGARVQGADVRVNFPTEHPLAVLDHPERGAGTPPLAAADVILAIDYDMHYAAPPLSPREDARILHIDIDTVKKNVPLWGRQPDIAVTGQSGEIVPALTAIFERRMTPEIRNKITVRKGRCAREHDHLAGEWRQLAESHADRTPVSAHWLSYCIDKVFGDNTIIVNQTISPSSIVANLVRRSRPGSLLSCAGGCIGWAPGAGLGAKLASPDKTVISLMGDGAFVYGCPEATLWTAKTYNAPFLGIIFNNRGYGAIKGLFRRRYEVENMGADISSPPDYAAVAAACGAFGMTVREPDGVMPALGTCLDKVRQGKPAILDVWIDPV